MPSELRRIVFSNDELKTALSEHNRHAKEKLPVGAVQACEPLPDGGGTVRLGIVNQSSGETQDVELSPETVGAALVRYCIQHKIPLPKRAHKSIHVQGDKVILNVSIEAAA